MYRSHKVSVILPCRNEGDHLAEVVKRIPKCIDEIIVVSNRSIDNTVAVAKKLGVKVYEDDRAINGIGYGYAHMTGIKHATGNIIVGIDGDATYPIEDIQKIIDSMLKRKLDFLSCNRYPVRKGTYIPWKLQLGVQVLNAETFFLYGKRVKDILSGMWVFKADIKDSLNLPMGDWNLSPQIKINAFTNPRIRAGEYSIAQHTRRGETKQNHFETGMSHLVWIASNRFGFSSPNNQYVMRFLIIGSVAFVLNALTLLVCADVFHIEKITAEIIAMVFSLNFTFYLHDNWTYVIHDDRSTGYKKPFLVRYTEYIISNIIGAGMTVGVFWLLSGLMPKLAALAIGALVAMIWNFIMNKIVIWKHTAE